MGDTDFGEIFLNFVLHERVRRFRRMALAAYFPEELNVAAGVHTLWEHWGRCGMRFTMSPYQTIQGVLWVEVIILGAPHDLENVFRWDVVQLNLPGA